MTCWVCSKPAVWKVTAEKQAAYEAPSVLVEFWACEKCVPFVEKAKGAAS